MQPQPADHLPPGSGGFSWPSAGVITFITFNSGMALYHSWHDVNAVSFIVSSYAHLMLLICCLWLHERAAHGSAWRTRLKASVWTLTTLLTFSFAYVVMGRAGLTLPMALLVWVITAATGIGASCAFFDRGRINQPLDEHMPPV